MTGIVCGMGGGVNSESGWTMARSKWERILRYLLRQSVYVHSRLLILQQRREGRENSRRCSSMMRFVHNHRFQTLRVELCKSLRLEQSLIRRNSTIYITNSTVRSRHTKTQCNCLPLTYLPSPTPCASHPARSPPSNQASVSQLGWQIVSRARCYSR